MTIQESNNSLEPAASQARAFDQDYSIRHPSASCGAGLNPFRHWSSLCNVCAPLGTSCLAGLCMKGQAPGKTTEVFLPL